MAEKIKRRMESQDIAKGLAILFVLSVHCFPVPELWDDIVYGLFHGAIAFFFVMAGYNYKVSNKPVSQNIKTRTWTLLKTYFIYVFGILLIMGIYFIIFYELTWEDITKYLSFVFCSRDIAPLIFNTDIKVFCEEPFIRFLMPLWFIQYLVTANILFLLVVNKVSKNFYTFFSVLIGFSAISFVFIMAGIRLPWGLHTAPAVCCLMLIGHYFKKLKLLENSTRKNIVWLNTLIALSIMAIFQVFYTGAGIFWGGAIGSIEGALEVFILYFVGIFSTYVLINISKLINKVHYVNTFLKFVGRNCLHFLYLHILFYFVICDILQLPHLTTFQVKEMNYFDSGYTAAFILTIVCISLFLFAKDKIIKYLKKSS